MNAQSQINEAAINLVGFTPADVSLMTFHPDDVPVLGLTELAELLDELLPADWDRDGNGRGNWGGDNFRYTGAVGAGIEVRFSSREQRVDVDEYVDGVPVFSTVFYGDGRLMAPRLLKFLAGLSL